MESSTIAQQEMLLLQEAINLLLSKGIHLCHNDVSDSDADNDDVSAAYYLSSILPSCQEAAPLSLMTTSSVSSSSSFSRSLLLAAAEEDPAAAGGGNDFDWDIIFNLAAALFCVCLAALAAGLTLGLLGMDPLMLLIKERAGETEQERKTARTLLPIVKQHHRLLVTLLLMNSLANEALPIFLEALVPSSLAVLLSVTLVLFFGEIIPSAIFTGPNQLQLANRLCPLVKTAMCLLYPIAGPIAKLLDCLLHDDEDIAAYNRGELSALIRIQYEERLASKRKLKQERARTAGAVQLLATNRVGAIEFPTQRPSASATAAVTAAAAAAAVIDEHRGILRAAKSHIEHETALSSQHAVSIRSDASLPKQQSTAGPAAPVSEEFSTTTSESIHPDEVMIVEGALQMKTKVAMDVMTVKRRVFSIPYDTILNERNMVKIYASGYSRIPVYRNSNTGDSSSNKNAICAVLITKQLIVVNPKDARPLHTLPLYCPICVSPDMRLVDLLNLLQTGGRALKGGHLALVCADSKLGNAALGRGEPLPKDAGWMGVVTIEDVLESLLQEQIYDEMDKYDRDAHRLASMVWRKWRKFVRRKKSSGELKGTTTTTSTTTFASVVREAMVEEGVAGETTALLKDGPGDKKSAQAKGRNGKLFFWQKS